MTQPLDDCDDTKWRCTNNVCIRKEWRCDGFKDCSDNSDEHNCDAHGEPEKEPVDECDETKWKCTNNVCIMKEERCDGFKDCSDNSDEQNCDAHTEVEKDVKNKESMSCSSLPVSCKDVNSTEDRVVVTLSSGIRVMCDTKTDGGGWTIFQRRINGRLSFYRGWEEYRFGFGSYADGEFYLGNENIYQLTSRRKHQLRIDLGFRGVRYFAQYSLFRILSENDNYQLKVSGYSGNATDNLSETHNDMQFSTFDKDNDKDSRNCASLYTGAWWYNECHVSNLNGAWGSITYGEGLNWNKLTTYFASVNFTEMKIREIEL
ncbi:Fibrinogen C domain-containing protein 1-A [Bulinus truncatus]|nr:Fibrinogen C domain-containing protein 1-A [Bulinus truncatus]